MKSIYLCVFLLGLSVFNPCHAQYVTIPDTAFVDWLQNNGFSGCLTGNQLDINLPDSLTSDSLSQGFVQYRIQVKDSLTAGTQIQNSASIYFDLNPAVLTNTTSDTVISNQPCTISYTTINDTACAGVPVIYNGLTYYAPISIMDTLQSSEGCDSIVTLNLYAKPNEFDTIYQTITCGDVFTFNGTPYTQTGSYNDTLPAADACDSIITLQLTVTGDTTYLSDNICANQPYVFNGAYVDTTGTYTALLTSGGGCDSTVILQLTVFPVAYTDTLVSIPCGDSVMLGSTFYKVAGTYNDTLTAANGCDSIITLQLTLTGGDTTYLYDTTCANQPILFNGNPLSAAGTYTAQYASALGCDSTVILQLTVNPVLTSDTAIAIACGDTIVFDGGLYYSAGTYTDTLLASSGCDSIVTLQLSVTGGDTTIIIDTTCANQPVLFNNTYVDLSGTYTAQYTSVSGCDSTVILLLTVKSVSFTDTAVSLACGDSVYFKGNYYKLPGTYIDTLNASNGCDSIIALQVSVPGNDTVPLYDTICSGDSALFNGVYLYTTGAYAENYITAGGCDSAIIFNLYVRPQPGAHLVKTISCGSWYAFGYNVYHLSGFYSDTITDRYGCDSISTLQLTISHADTTYASDTICANEPLYFNGIYLDSSGTYTTQYGSLQNCDSMVILQLTVKPAPVVTFTWDSLLAEHDVDSVPTTLPIVFWCAELNPDSFTLSGGNPPGGSYSGTNVYGNVFIPGNFAPVIPIYDTLNYHIIDTDICVGYAYFVIAVTTCTGIQTLSPDNLFDLYPNPAGDYTMIAVSPNAIGATMKLLDVTGKELMSMKLTASPQQLPLSGLAAGVYMVEVETNGEIATKLLVKTQ